MSFDDWTLNSYSWELRSLIASLSFPTKFYQCTKKNDQVDHKMIIRDSISTYDYWVAATRCVGKSGPLILLNSHRWPSWNSSPNPLVLESSDIVVVLFLQWKSFSEMGGWPIADRREITVCWRKGNTPMVKKYKPKYKSWLSQRNFINGIHESNYNFPTRIYRIFHQFCCRTRRFQDSGVQQFPSTIEIPNLWT
jgi:hypothetical protein